MTSSETFSASGDIFLDGHVLIAKADDFLFTVFTSLYDRLFGGVSRSRARFVARHAILVHSLSIVLFELL